MHWIERVLIGLIVVSLACLFIEIDVEHTLSDQRDIGPLAIIEDLIAEVDPAARRPAEWRSAAGCARRAP